LGQHKIPSNSKGLHQIKFKRAASNEVGWPGLFFNFSVPGSELAYCRIEGATNSAIYIDNSLPTISNCTIINNSISESVSQYGGGIYALGTLTLNDCTIKNNSISASYSSGGGSIFAFGGGIYVDGICNLSNCVIQGNSTYAATGFSGNVISRGGGIYVDGEFNLTNCIISYNTTDGSEPGFSPTIEGGGAYFIASDSSFITNTTIAYNDEEGLRTVGGGIVTITNSIIYFNTPQANQIVGSPNVSYCDVQGGFTGTGNINSNPVFLSETELNIVLGSQCVDAGDPNSVYNDVCFPPSLGTERNDMGAHGGPGACDWTITNIENNNIITFPTQFLLQQNYPNPFNPGTTIKYQIPELSFVTLKVYDVLGNEIETLVNEEKLIGSYDVEFNATVLPSGIYFYRLQAGSFVETKKMVFIFVASIFEN